MNHTPLDREILDKKYTELEEEVRREEAETALDLDQSIYLHPSLDFRDNIGVFGFRVKQRDKKGEPVFMNLFVIIQDTKAKVSYKNEIKIGGRTYYIDDKNKLLATLDDKWTVEGLKQLITAPHLYPFNEIFDRLQQKAQKYFYLSDSTEYDLVTAWIIGTYFHRVFFSYPFLHIKAPKGSGKSQLLGFLEKTCFNAIKSRSTAANLGDMISSLRGTYILDQADSLHTDNNAELREILTDSYKKDGGKRRVLDMNKGRKQLEFETYCPKAFASTIELPDDLRDRCILIPIIRTTRNFPTPDEQNENWHAIRGELYKFLLHFQTVQKIYNQHSEQYKNNPTLTGRTLDLWMPIETIMAFCRIDKDRIERAKTLYLSRYQYMQFEPQEHEQEVLSVIMSKFQGSLEHIEIPVKEITKEINTVREARRREELESVEYLNEKKVGWVIKNYNLFSGEKRTNTGKVYFFERKKIEESYKQYFATPEETAQQHEREVIEPHDSV